MKRSATSNESMFNRLTSAIDICLAFAENTSSEEGKKQFTAAAKNMAETAKIIKVLSEGQDSESEGLSKTLTSTDEGKNDDPVIEKLPDDDQYEIIPPKCTHPRFGFVKQNSIIFDGSWSNVDYNVEYEKSWGKYGFWVVKRRSDNKRVMLEPADTTKVVLYGGDKPNVEYDRNTIPKKILRVEYDNYWFVAKEGNQPEDTGSITFSWDWVTYNKDDWIVSVSGDPNFIKNTFPRDKFYLKVKRGGKIIIYE
jgi:hypothetical protein